MDSSSVVRALEERRRFFRQMGAAATDHAAETARTNELTPSEAATVFQHALEGRGTQGKAARFTASILIEMARMSLEEGLVTQLYPGALRSHNAVVFEALGPAQGGDIPLQGEFTRNLRSLLSRFGNDPRLTVMLCTLDGTTCAGELAPLAGHHPAARPGPPRWCHDSPCGMRRYVEQAMETASLHNMAGFNDDTRAFFSIPARHDAWRRVP